MALSGIPKDFHKLVKHQLKTNFDKMVEDLIYIFSPTSNVVLKGCKKCAILSERWNQTILFNSDFCMRDSGSPITAKMKLLKNNDYVLEKC